MADERDTLRAPRLKGSQTPRTPKKMPRKILTVKKTHTSTFSEDWNVSSSLIEGTNGVHKEAEMDLTGTPRCRADSFHDKDSPWQNGQFKSPKEIVRYYRQQFGDWWNVLPKTDFTYDERSKWYRKEIAPGIPVIPNLARPPLHPAQHKSRFSLFSRSTESTFESSSTNGKSQLTRPPIIQEPNKSFLTKVADFFIDLLLGILCLPYDLIFGNYWSTTAPVTGRNSSKQSAWWSAPFRWTYQLMMMLFSWEIKILISVRQAFHNFGLRTAFKLFLLLVIIGGMVFAYGYYGVELDNIQMPSINISDLQNFTNWDYSGAIELLKPLNMSWAYDQYANYSNIGWIYQ
ncbi:uncharacterized protein LOC111047601 isoform X2 [Nilaparvata lugens]|uniref:uncharacterized protein LOC111047601 isoform X1 n=1 Tax=Nilaparvata lugens TaxID=108931 RepID=UPI00193E23A6|nr:uncharacterized protein LOC111047601 isoform X1 [Nilaparvata lugens]XP_039282397.1 uncharacterized protein LOC111047601 isoform X2 [Nilaparvata lugens]